MTTNSWWLEQSGAGAAAWNMAFDETLLESSSRLENPILRFYSWTEPAATFGYFQRIGEVEKTTQLHPLIRRPTGGGIVPHDADWTYSLAFPPGHEWYELRATDSYYRLHDWLKRAFNRLDFETTLAPSARKEMAGQCFVGFEKDDLLQGSAKIAGAAQRRTRQGLLIQGSVQPPAQVVKADWQKAMCDVAHQQWGVDWRPFEAPGWLRSRAADLAKEKFATDSYNRKR